MNQVDAVLAQRSHRGHRVLFGLGIALLMTVLVCTALGAVRLPIQGLLGLDALSSGHHTILLDVRLPRMVLAALVGASLATSGCAMQAIFRNPLATPYVLGIASGASVGASISFLMGLAAFWVPINAFALGLGAAFLVYGLARVQGRVAGDRLLLAGVAMGLFFSALLSVAQYLAGERELRQIVFWLMGGLWNASWERMAYGLVPMALGVAGLLSQARVLNLLLLGEEQALDAGLDVEPTRRRIVVFATLAAAGAVSLTGVIGFVGLIVPHALRFLTGPDHRTLLPASALGGAVFLLWADLAARTVIAPAELPVGILTGLCGAPFFLVLLRLRGRA